MGDFIPDQCCHECLDKTDIIFDRTSGDVVCTECGLVLQARCAIDDILECNNGDHEFDNDDVDDPVSVSNLGPVDPLLSYGGLSTILAGADASRYASPLTRAFSEIDDIGDRLGLLTCVKDCAKDLYRGLNEKLIRNKTKDSIYAACLFKACKQQNVPRTIKEICSAINNVTRKDLGKATRFIDQQLSMQIVSNPPSDLINRFCSTLGIKASTTKMILNMVKRCEAMNLRRNSSSIVAGVIYMITEKSDEKKAIKDIAFATGVSQTTIKMVSEEIKSMDLQSN